MKGGEGLALQQQQLKRNEALTEQAGFLKQNLNPVYTLGVFFVCLLHTCPLPASIQYGSLILKHPN